MDLAEWEVDALLAMDGAWMEAQKPTQVADAPNVVSERKLSPALFEALF